MECVEPLKLAVEVPPRLKYETQPNYYRVPKLTNTITSPWHLRYNREGHDKGGKGEPYNQYISYLPYLST